MSIRLTLRVLAGIAATAALAHTVSVLASCAAEAPVPGVRHTANNAPVTDDAIAVARRYAPILWHATDRKRGREDLPCPVDFDGNLTGNDDWENCPAFALVPTVMYAVVATDTHWFVTYHLFHPRDWAPVPLGLQDTHENDGENLQVVAAKDTGLPVLVYTQAHYCGRAYANDRSRFDHGAVDLRGGFATFGADGTPDPTATHVGVFVESQGHGIYGLLDHCARVEPSNDGAFQFRDQGLVLRPALDGEIVTEPTRFTDAVVPYQLESTLAKLWPGVRDGSLVGEGLLFDGAVRYHDASFTLERMPRYYDGNRYSGPLGNDRGISPFAVSFGFACDAVGALFFDPAHAWPRAIEIVGDWSTQYRNCPWR